MAASMTRPEIGRPDLHDTGKKHCENYCIGTFRRGSGLYTATAEYLILNNRLRGHTWGGVGWVRVAIIESSGTTSLQLDGSNHYVLTGSLTATLRFGGGPVTMNQFGAWTPIGAEQSGQNFVVVWRNTVLNQYVTWTVDGNGNFLSQSALLSPTSFALESLETPFGQNLNGDGTTGLTTAPIEAIGSTTLTQVADFIL